MYEFILMIKYSLLQSLGFFILAIAAIALLFIILYTVSKKFNLARYVAIPVAILCIGIFLLFFSPQIFPNHLKYPFFLKTFGPADGPELPFEKCLHFFKNIKNFERVDIAKDPTEVTPVQQTEPSPKK